MINMNQKFKILYLYINKPHYCKSSILIIQQSLIQKIKIFKFRNSNHSYIHQGYLIIQTNYMDKNIDKNNIRNAIKNKMKL